MNAYSAEPAKFILRKLKQRISARPVAATYPSWRLAVAGKGHEQGQTIGTTTLPFDDVQTVRVLAGLA